MPEYVVDVECTTSGYTYVNAESKEEAIRLVESGDYEDIFGEDFVSLVATRAEVFE